MAYYGMVVGVGNEIIHKTEQPTLKQAIKYFSGVKQISVEEFRKLFTVIKIQK